MDLTTYGVLNSKLNQNMSAVKQATETANAAAETALKAAEGAQSAIGINDTETSVGYAYSSKKTQELIEKNNISTVGKNIFDASKIERSGNGSLNAQTGEIIEGTRYVYEIMDNLEIGETYTISKNSSAVSIYFYNDDGSYMSATKIKTASGAVSRLTFTAECKKYRILTYKAASEMKLQLEKGSIATEYEPYKLLLNESVVITNEDTLNRLLSDQCINNNYVQDGNLDLRKMNFSERTYNVLDPLKCVSGYLSSGGGSVVESSSFFTTDFIEIGAIKNLVSNVKMYSVCLYDEKKSSLGHISSGELNSTECLISNETAKYVRVSYLGYLSTAAAKMLYFGESGKSFVPYTIIPLDYIGKEENYFPDVSIVLTQNVVVAENKSISINHQSILTNIDIKNTKRSGFVTGNGGYPTYDYKTIITGGVKPDGEYTFNSTLDYGVSVAKKFNIINVDENAGSGQTKKVLFIGDSKTDANVYTQKLLDMFDDDVMSIELLGTRGSGINKHEGRSSWSAENYVMNNASGGVLEDSPFWNLSTEKFDFSYYMSQNGYDSVDYVFICLGTNDSASNFISYYHELIDGIRKYDENIIIGLWVPAPFATFGGYSYLDNVGYTFTKMQAILDEFDNEECRNDNIFVVPTHMNIDTFYDYKWIDVPINELTDVTYRKCTDQIHESNGYKHLSEVIFGYIKYFATLN